jgi:hypothetical protein
MLEHAVIASEAEAVAAELSAGLSLDCPRAIEAAGGAVDAVFRAPFLAVACAHEALSGGRLRDHSAASAVVSAAAARVSGRGRDECLELAAAALLHDAAMHGIADDLLAVTGPLSPEGRRAVRRHPLRALSRLADADGFAPAAAIAAFQVHERPDGSGYPLGLVFEEITCEARLLAACDVLCALLAPRPHRPDFVGREATELCVRLAGEGSLDGGAVRALLRAIGLYPVGSAVRLTTGEVARVVAVSEEDYALPVVSVVRTADGRRPSERRVLDLSRGGGAAIERPASREEAPWEGAAGF